MKTDQNNTVALSALLRATDSVDAPVINSLCCAAAGITALPQATAKARIPHEKLRGAATPDATLIAQDRPLAQPVVGYECSSSFSINFRYGVLEANNVGRKIILNLAQTPFEPPPNAGATRVARADRSQKIQNNQPHIIGALEQDLVGSLRLQRTQALKDIQHPSFNKSAIPPKPIGVRLIPLGKQMLYFLNEASQLKAVSYLSLILLGFSSKPLKPSLPSRNSTRCQDRANRTNCLHPARCSLTFPGPRTYPPTYQHNQHNQGRQHQSLQRRDDGNGYDNFLGQHVHLLAVNGGGRLPHLPFKIQGAA